jgi:hypothetical protein
MVMMRPAGACAAFGGGATFLEAQCAIARYQKGGARNAFVDVSGKIIKYICIL